MRILINKELFTAMGLIYCMADIHGEYEKYKRLLKAIDLRESDTLYVLGDVLDCGAQSMEVLFDMMRRLNPFQRNRK